MIQIPTKVFACINENILEILRLESLISQFYFKIYFEVFVPPTPQKMLGLG
jgi:hypothetical protein